MKFITALLVCLLTFPSYGDDIKGKTEDTTKFTRDLDKLSSLTSCYVIYKYRLKISADGVFQSELMNNELAQQQFIQVAKSMQVKMTNIVFSQRRVIKEMSAEYRIPEEFFVDHVTRLFIESENNLYNIVIFSDETGNYSKDFILNFAQQDSYCQSLIDVVPNFGK